MRLLIVFLFLIITKNGFATTENTSFSVANNCSINNTSETELAVVAPSGYAIKVKIEGLKSKDMLKMGYHFGSKQYLKDSTTVDNKGLAIFKGAEPLEGGMYFILLPENAGFFEFLVQEQHFSMETDKSDLVGKMKVKGSKENELFFENLQWNKQKSEEAQSLNEQKNKAETAKEKEEIQEKIDNISKEAAERLVNFKAKESDKLFTQILSAGNEPVIPDSLQGNENKAGALAFLKANYFDTFDFSDPRLARTGILPQKIEHYTSKIVVQNADTLAKACDKILALAKADTNHYKIALTNLLNSYANPKIMGMDAVYVHLVENYYNEKDAWWVKPADLYRIQERAKDMKPTLIGQKAPDFKLQDANGKYHHLYSIETEYVVLYFWDPDCGHCKKTSPKLVQFAKDNPDLDMTILTLTTENEEEKWLAYLEKNPEVAAFINLADFKYRSRFRQEYDITGTPRIFVLDKEKIIVAKKIQPNQIRPIIDRLSKD